MSGIEVAHVIVCRNCHLITAASGDPNGPLVHPGPWTRCPSSSREDGQHWMISVPVALPIP